MQDHRIITGCLLCDHTDLALVLSLEPTPPANQLVKEPIEQKKYPLELLQCQNCKHCQISCIVDPAILYRDYYYVSGTSKITREHFRKYAEKLINELKLDSHSFVIDIGSNDGTMLSNFKKQNIKVLGIDPAIKISEQANKNGIETLPEFFNLFTAKDVLKKYSQSDLIVCNNMFAHNDNLNTIVEGIKLLLKDSGSFVFEVSYLMDILDSGAFDLIYHEHIHQHHLTPLIKFFKKFDMIVYDIECIDIQCGSIRIYVSKEDREIRSSVKEIIELERVIDNKLEKFSSKINEIRYNLTNLLKQYKSEGKKIIGYGASAKSTTLLHYFGIGTEILDAIIDDSEWKQGYLTPGTHISIVKSNHLCNYDVCLILSINFADDIIKQNKEFLDRGGIFIVPIPNVKIVGGYNAL